MILFNDRATYITILHVHMTPELSVDNLGCIAYRRIIGQEKGTWEADFTGRNWSALSDLLDGSEKRQIIGLLDKLNGLFIGLEDPEAQWNDIIGQRESYKVHCCDECGRKWRSDKNGDICVCGKSAILGL